MYESYFYQISRHYSITFSINEKEKIKGVVNHRQFLTKYSTPLVEFRVRNGRVESFVKLEPDMEETILRCAALSLLEHRENNIVN